MQLDKEMKKKITAVEVKPQKQKKKNYKTALLLPESEFQDLSRKKNKSQLIQTLSTLNTLKTRNIFSKRHCYDIEIF